MRSMPKDLSSSPAQTAAKFAIMTDRAMIPGRRRRSWMCCMGKYWCRAFEIVAVRVLMSFELRACELRVEDKNLDARCMSILVVGSVAFDSLETPSGKRERVLGGAATHFSLAASFFTKVRVVGVVGEDFLPEHEAVLTSKGVDTAGIERAPGKSFHWRQLREGHERRGDAGDRPECVCCVRAEDSEELLDSEYLFLANIDPVLQARVRAQMPNVKMVAGDTMNYWIAAIGEPAKGTERAGRSAD